MDRVTDLRGLTVAVTGANGFLGGAIVSALRRARASVRAFVGPPASSGADMPGDRDDPGAMVTLRGEITDGGAVRSIAEGADVLIHAAGPPSVAASFERPAEYARVHTVGTATALDTCRRTGVRRVVYISSAEVYGAPATRRVTERSHPHARSPYAAAKIGAEHLVRTFAGAGYVRAAILRPFSIYGPRLPRGSLIDTLVRQACGGTRVTVRDLRPVRDYCYVDDVARAAVLACAGDHRDLTVNIGTGCGTSVAELASLVLTVIGRSAPIERADAPSRPEQSDILHLVADPRRALRTLGWAPRVSLEDGLEATIAWIRTSNGSS